MKMIEGVPKKAEDAMMAAAQNMVEILMEHANFPPGAADPTVSDGTRFGVGVDLLAMATGFTSAEIVKLAAKAPNIKAGCLFRGWTLDALQDPSGNKDPEGILALEMSDVPFLLRQIDIESLEDRARRRRLIQLSAVCEVFLMAVTAAAQTVGMMEVAVTEQGRTVVRVPETKARVVPRWHDRKDPPCELLFAPSMMFEDVTVLPMDLADELRNDAILDGRIPASQIISFGPPEIVGTGGKSHRWTTIMFPMEAANFALYGWLLMDYFHRLCFGSGEVEEGNEWLLFYKDPEGKNEGQTPPASSMMAVLYVSADQGKTWNEASNYLLAEPDTSNLN